jgi:hypothetical protein
MARFWYERAKQLGSSEAPRRLEQLESSGQIGPLNSTSICLAGAAHFLRQVFTSVGVAQSRGGFDERVENRLEVKSRGADQPEHVRRCRLLFESLIPLAGEPRDFVVWLRSLGLGKYEAAFPDCRALLWTL